MWNTAATACIRCHSVARGLNARSLTVWRICAACWRALIRSHSIGDCGTGKTCVLTCDVWEHAYYIDYRNARPKYLEEFWKLVNWGFANKNLG